MGNWSGGPGGRVQLYPDPKGDPTSVKISDKAKAELKALAHAGGVTFSDAIEYVARKINRIEDGPILRELIKTRKEAQRAEWDARRTSRQEAEAPAEGVVQG